ncbi:MAG: hypothetical protein KAY04_05860 [Burkholderiales bacterium]|nr:hypothetical protein [Burkholderiales bacterium]
MFDPFCKTAAPAETTDSRPHRLDFVRLRWLIDANTTKLPIATLCYQLSIIAIPRIPKIGMFTTKSDRQFGAWPASKSGP